MKKKEIKLNTKLLKTYNKKEELKLNTNLLKTYNMFKRKFLHYPPVNQEWDNSVYMYNKNNNTIWSVIDIIVNNLIKSYFLLELNIKKKIKYVKRYVHKSTNRILVSKAELKHTTDKVLITIFTYNRYKKYIIRKIKRTLIILKKIKINTTNKKINHILNKIKKYGLKRYKMYIELKYIELEKQLKEIKKNRRVWKEKKIFFNKKGIKDKIWKIKKLNKKLKKSSNIREKIIKQLEIIKEDISIIKLEILGKLIKNKNKINYKLIYKNPIYKPLALTMIKIIQEKKKYKIMLNKLYLYNKNYILNNYKFKDFFLFGLKNLISKIYLKKVEFRIINLKKIQLNSDILLKILSIKLKNRRNRILRVLKKTLRLVKLPKFNPYEYYTYLDKLNYSYLNKHNTINIKLIYNLKKKNNKDILHKFLYKLYSINKNFNYLKNINNVKKNIFNFIKHKYIKGIRLEGGGRLTKRLTASRSILKLKYKGSIKNIDSSYKGLSTVMLKGYVRSNIQITSVNSKTRNGSFGLEGWISSY